MSAPKYLRAVEVRSDAIMDVLHAADVNHIPALVERLFTPTPSHGIAKVSVSFARGDIRPTIENLLDVVIVTWPFDADSFPKLGRDAQREYYLRLLHAALTFAAERFKWDTARLNACCTQIARDGFRAQWMWPARPRLNPTRQLHAQVLVEMDSVTRAWVVFSRSSGAEVSRVLFTNLGRGVTTGSLDYVLGDLAWTDAETVRVRHENHRDYWLISANGDIRFIFPPAESGDSQGLYQLARLHWEGRFITVNRVRALELMRRAAALGDKHARRFLERNAP